MNTEQKYFTPSIEDVYVGYEYEFHGMSVGGMYFFNADGSKDENLSKEATIPVYYKEKITLDPWATGRDFKSFMECLNRGQIRVPVLTHELIEAEGWKKKDGWSLVKRAAYAKEGVNFWAVVDYTSEFPFVQFVPIDPSLCDPSWHLPRGLTYCKDINTFRQLVKLVTYDPGVSNDSRPEQGQLHASSDSQPIGSVTE
jgi:hypothetical protein